MRDSFRRVLGAATLACASLACNEHPKPSVRAEDPAPAASARAGDGPEVVSGGVPVAPFVAEELAKAPAGGATLVYVGASWCEPCQRFHRALEAGELDGELRGFRFIDYDLDVAREELGAAGYRSKLIPLFALPKSDGNATGRQVEGSVKGDGAILNIMPRLLELTGRRKPSAE